MSRHRWITVRAYFYKVLMSLAPRSLWARLFLLLIVSLLMVQLTAVWMLLYDREERAYRIFGPAAAKQIAGIVNFLETITDEERYRLVQALDVPPTRVFLDEPWGFTVSHEVLGSSKNSNYFYKLLQSQLDRYHAISVRTTSPSVSDISVKTIAGDSRLSNTMRLMTIITKVRLLDGQTVTFHYLAPEDVLSWPTRAVVISAIMLLSVLLISLFSVVWMTRPLLILAKAADELGRDIDSQPLPETGPIEVARAAHAFNTMQARLRRYLDGRASVLAAVSHDLKTPITRLRLRSELLDNEALRTKIESDLDEMESLVNSTLEFMRSGESHEAYTLVHLNALMESIIDDMETLGAEIVLKGHISHPVNIRPLDLRRCLVNLLNNAFRYAGNPLEIHLESSATQLIIRVLDHGVGVPEKDLERIFEPFFRLENSRARKTGGSGLGLSIARNIVRNHGGELILCNRPEGGLEARVELPR